MSMKLTILGSGTLVPSGTRNSAGYFVELSDARIMLDCGAGTVHALARYDLPWEQMTHLFVSHFHIDHMGELASLLFAFRYGMKTARTESLTIIGPAGLDRVMDGLKTSFGPKLFEGKFPIRVRMLEPGDCLELGPYSTLTVAKTPHTSESLAVRIESNESHERNGGALCYTGDTAYDDELARFFSGTDLLISECSFREPREEVAHLSVSEASRLAAQAGAAKLIVTHFYFDVNDAELREELERGYGGEVVIGCDGLRVEVP
jgi:ribonuclease BN (tRNA processing enzyme)